jgi:hypothetical protein
VVHIELAAQKVCDVVALFDALGLSVHIVRVVAFDTALGAGAVIADDGEDDRVVGLALFADGVEQSANLVIGLLQISGVDLGLMSE